MKGIEKKRSIKIYKIKETTIFFTSKLKFTSRIIKKKQKWLSILGKNKRFVARWSKTLEREASENERKRSPLEKLRSANLKFEIPDPGRLLASRQVPSYFTRFHEEFSHQGERVALRRQLKYLRDITVSAVWVGCWVGRVYSSRAREKPCYTPLK